LPALDSESSRTLFRDKEIDIVRRLDLPTNSTDFRIHTENGQVARIREEIELPLQLKDVSRTRNDCFPKLVVLCIMGINFLCSFEVGLDFASWEWHFANRPREQYTFKEIREENTN